VVSSLLGGGRRCSSIWPHDRATSSGARLSFSGSFDLTHAPLGAVLSQAVGEGVRCGVGTVVAGSGSLAAGLWRLVFVRRHGLTVLEWSVTNLCPTCLTHSCSTRGSRCPSCRRRRSAGAVVARRCGRRRSFFGVDVPGSDFAFAWLLLRLAPRPGRAEWSVTHLFRLI
jgi:hypothetical protein